MRIKGWVMSKGKKVYGAAAAAMRRARGRKGGAPAKASGKTRRVRGILPRRRRYASNPRGILATPAVKIGTAAGLGVGVGLALDQVERPSWLAWLPAGIPLSSIVGLIVAGVAYYWGRGETRELGMAAGIGLIAGGVAPKIKDAVLPMLSGATTTTQTPALAARRVFRLQRPQRGAPATSPAMAARNLTRGLMA